MAIPKLHRIFQAILIFFTLNIAQPTLVSFTPDPTANTTPTLLWNSVPSATNYKIELDDDVSFATPIVSMTISGALSFTVQTPLSTGYYYWHVSSNLDYTLYSSMDGFAVYIPPVDKPILIPVTPDPTSNPNPTLFWKSIPSVYGYKIELDDEISFATPIVSTTISGSSSFSVQTPLSNGHYYWHVSCNLDYTLYSDPDDFIENTSVVRPTLIPVTPDPLNNPKPTLLWNSIPSASSYKIELDDDISFATPIVSTTTSGASSFTVQTPLSTGRYYWHISSNLDYLLYSFTDDFRVTNSQVDKPVLIHYNADPLSTANPILTWYHVSSECKYKIEVDNDISFATPVATETINDSTAFTISVPLAKGTYYWHVSSNYDYTLYSLVDSFTLSNATQGLIDGTIDHNDLKFKVKSNILLGNSLVTIPVNASDVNIVIVNLVGKKIMATSLRSSDLQQEFMHSIQSRLRSGNYVVKLEFIDKNGFYLNKITKPLYLQR